MGGGRRSQGRVRSGQPRRPVALCAAWQQQRRCASSDEPAALRRLGQLEWFEIAYRVYLAALVGGRRRRCGSAASCPTSPATRGADRRRRSTTARPSSGCSPWRRSPSGCAAAATAGRSRSRPPRRAPPAAGARAAPRRAADPPGGAALRVAGLRRPARRGHRRPAGVAPAARDRRRGVGGERRHRRRRADRRCCSSPIAVLVHALRLPRWLATGARPCSSLVAQGLARSPGGSRGRATRSAASRCGACATNAVDLVGDRRGARRWPSPPSRSPAACASSRSCAAATSCRSCASPSRCRTCAPSCCCAASCAASSPAPRPWFGASKPTLAGQRHPRRLAARLARARCATRSPASTRMADARRSPAACAPWSPCCAARPRRSLGIGVALYLLGLDAIEPLSQEIDHPDHTDGVPHRAGLADGPPLRRAGGSRWCRSP